MSTSATVDDMYPVRPGANDNAGGRYEYLLSSYVALKLLKSSSSNFKVSINSEEFGDFDDVIVEILGNGSTITESWAVQLKHKAKKKAITTLELGAVKGDFSLQKYFEDYRQQKYLAKPVLFTNKRFSEDASIEIEEKPYVLTSRKSSAIFPFNTLEDGGVFQFDIKLKTGQAAGDAEEFKNWQIFLKNFYLCANQQNVDQLDREVSKLFTTALGCVADESYKKFFEKYWAQKPVKDNKKEKLQRREIEREVARIALGPYAEPTIDSKVNSAEENMLKTIISRFDVTLIDAAACDTQIANLWQLCDIPSIVTVSEANKDSIYNVLDVLKTGTYKFLFVGGDCLDADKLKNWKVFDNLSNLERGNFQTITDKFSCVVQGRNETCLGEILKNNEQLNSVIKVGHLFRMMDRNKPFVIGDETVELPVPFIPRSIPKHVFSCELIENLANGDVLVISYCGDVNKLEEMVNKHKRDTTKIVTDRDVIFESNAESSPMIFISKDKCPEIWSKIQKQRSVLHFEFVNNSLNLLSSHGTLSKFIRFCDKYTDETVRDSEILTNFSNKTNVLLADPGMGKTVCGDFIKQVCPFDAWPIRISLRETLSLFATCTNVQDLLTNILDTSQSDWITCRFKEYYKNDKQLMLIWDGLDEVGTEHVDLVIKKIEEISRVTGHHQWITSRCHLREKLESVFNVVSITLTEVTSDEQRKYIEKRLQEVYPEKIRDVTNDIHERIIKNNLKDMLGIPLLLNMFTTICSRPENYERIRKNELSLTQIYSMFIDAKFDRHFAEKVVGNVENTVHRMQCEEHKAYRMKKYSKASLLTCFDSDFLEEIDVNCCDFLKNVVRNGDFIGLITKITDKNTPIFLHKTIAEYFAALYLTKNYKKLGPAILNRLLFRAEYRNIRFMFDMCLSENQPAHQAVLAMNLDKLTDIAEKNKDMILWQDEGGRNVLHLACSYGTSRLPLQLSSKHLSSRIFTNEYNEIPSHSKTFDATPLYSLKKENKDYENIVEYLVSIADQKTINDTDKIYGLNCVGYADASLSLYAIESLLKSCEVTRGNFQQFLRNYKDTETLLAYSLVLNYENLSSVFDVIPYFELFWETCAPRLVKFWDVRFEDLKVHNILILIIEFGCIDLLRKALKNDECIKHVNDRIDIMRESNLYDTDPLLWAVKKDKFDMFHLLLQHKPDLKTQYGMGGCNILQIAVELGQTKIVKYIVDKKLIEIDIRNQHTGETPLLIASEAGDLDVVIYLIATGAKVDVTNFKKENLLHLACKEGHFKIVQYLVENYKILQEQLDINGKTPLLTAAEKGRFDFVVYLKENGANFKATDKDGRNLLHYACLKENLFFIKSLTKENLIEFDTQDCDGYTPLLKAASTYLWSSTFKIVEYLMKNGVDFKAKNKKGQNLLHYACLAQNVHIIKHLTKEKLLELDTQDCDGNTPLLTAAFYNRFDIVEYLVENGLNFKAKNEKGQNLLHFACMKQNLPFIKHLTKEKLLELDTQDCDGYTPLLTAAFYNRFDIVEYLVENGLNFKAKNKNGRNLLHFACVILNLPFIKRLTMENLIELDTQDCYGYTPLLTAAFYNRFDIVEYLMENGLNFKAKNKNGHNLLHFACAIQNLPFIKRLTMENLIELDIQDCDHYTPLLRSASNNRFDIVEYLLKSGLNFKTKNRDGCNVLHFACWEGHLPFIKRLTKENLIELHTQDYRDLNPSCLAVFRNHYDIVEYLLGSGVNFKAKNKKGQNLLHFACLTENFLFIKRLTKENLIEFDTQDCNGFNPLLTAASRNRFDIVEYFLENGVNLKAKNKKGQNLLHFACMEQNLHFIKSLTKEHLIEFDTQDCDDHTPLLTAAANNYFDIVEYLLENGLTFKAKNEKGQNLLHFACMKQNLPFIKRLTKEKLLELDTQNCVGITPLLTAALYNHFDIVEYLLENGLNWKTKNENEQNLLHFACMEQNLPFIKRLTKEKLLELETQDCVGDTPLLTAAFYNHFDIVEYLLGNGLTFKAKNENGQNLLHFACMKQNLPFIKRLTKEKLLELETQDCVGDTPLLTAAFYNHFDIVEYLLGNGLTFKAKNENGQNLLHFACMKQNLPFIKRLTKEKLLELETQDCVGDTPLLTAAFYNHFDIVEYLLGNGLTFKAKNENGQNLLHFACMKQNLPFIKRLTKKHLIEFDTQDCVGDTPLLIAAFYNHFDIVEYLLENGLNWKTKNENEQNLLHFACMRKNLPVIKRLTKENLLELDTQDCVGDTPLLTAAFYNHFDIVEYLLGNGLTFKAKNEKGQNLLHFACMKQNLPFIKRLTKKHLIEFDTQDCVGDTPLLIAAFYNHFDIVEYLLENGLNWKAKNENGQNLLHFACLTQNLPFIKRLTKENLIELDTQDCDGNTPLLRAAFYNHFDIVEYLLENGLNFKTKNKKRQNLLHFACTRKNLPFIKRLTKEKLLKLDTQDYDGYTPLLRAASNNYFDIVEYLLKNGADFKVNNQLKQNILYFAAKYGVSIQFFTNCLKSEDWNALHDLET